MLAGILAALPAAKSVADSMGDVVLRGSVVSTQFTTKDQTKALTLTGFAPSVMWLLDRSRRYTLGLSVQPFINFAGGEIAREAIDGVVQWVILGQTRKLDYEYAHAHVTSTGTWALTANLHVGIHYYHAGVQLQTGRRTITGSGLQALPGLGLRFDLTDESSVGVDALFTLISLSNSSDNLKASEFQTGAYYRFEF